MCDGYGIAKTKALVKGPLRGAELVGKYAIPEKELCYTRMVVEPCQDVTGCVRVEQKFVDFCAQ